VTVKAASILVVDDDPSLRRVVAYQLEQDGFRVTSAGSGAEALEAARGGGIDLLITDVMMPGMDGLELVDRIRASAPDVVPIVITAHGDVATAVRAMQSGAFDFVEKPFTRERLQASVGKAIAYAGLRDENRRLRALVGGGAASGAMVGSSSSLRAFLDDLRLAADSDATVLLFGESGTGKELAARAIHEGSPRRDRPFVVVNCAAIPESLVESELFGHRKGSFTGAIEDRKGQFESTRWGHPPRSAWTFGSSPRPAWTSRPAYARARSARTSGTGST
jgi:DNA-binding NtrC family response regulator